MALATCNDCNNQISDNADLCPHCGRPMLSEIATLIVRSIVVFGLIFMALFF